MNKAKLQWKGTFFLKIYFTVIIFLISFFTIFAFRYDVIDYLAKYQIIPNQVDEKTITSIQKQISDIEASNENIEIIDEIISDKIKDHAFQVANYGESELNEGDTFVYFYYPNGSTPGKYAVANAVSYHLEFKNTPALLVLYPTYNEFLNLYNIFAICMSIVITFVFLIFANFINKKKWIDRIKEKLKNKKPFNLIRHLSTKLILINIIAIVLAVSLFMFMYINKYAFFEFVRESSVEKNNYASLLNELRDTSMDLTMTKKNKKQISEILNQYSSEETYFYLYDEDGLYYVGGEVGELGNYFIRESFYDVSAVYTPFIQMFSVPFKEQTGLVIAYSYQLIEYVIPYVVTIFLISFSIYILILWLFISKKVLELKNMQEDVSVLANGDWKHEIVVNGNDEIADLGNHLNHMRISFLENMENEKAARNANRDLISAMSHDLRTPLTTLNGYLEIVQLEKGNKEKREEYIKRCLDKVEEIRDLSNKMFEYSLVFSTDDITEMNDVQVLAIHTCLEDHIQYLKVLGFHVNAELITSNCTLKGNFTMLKRVFNNLFSNMQKYADMNREITITMDITKNCLKMAFYNYKKVECNPIESNGIGLKSIRKIVEIHNGECYINNNENDFVIIITLPMMEEKDYAA